jgi:hypothetical protein
MIVGVVSAAGRRAAAAGDEGTTPGKAQAAGATFRRRKRATARTSCG